MIRKSIHGITFLLIIASMIGFDISAGNERSAAYDILCDRYEKWITDVRVSSDAEVAYDSSIAWTGTEYGISWCDFRDENFEIYFARLDASGSMIGTDVRITSASDDCAYPVLAWTGTEYGLSWADHRDGNWEIYFARMSSSGSKIGSDVRVTSNAADAYDPSLIWAGTEYALSWYDVRDGNWEIYFARISSSGSKIGSDIRVTNKAEDSYGSSLAWTGSEYGLSWVDFRNGNWEIYFTRLNASGSKIGSDIRVTNNSEKSYSSSLVWTGTEYGVSWYDYRDGNWEVYFARLDSSGSKIGSDTRVTRDSSDSRSSSLIWSGSDYGISWYDYRDENWEIYFTRLDPSGSKIGSDIRVTNEIASSGYPTLVSAGEEFSICWEDERWGIWGVYFTSLKCCTGDFDNDNDGWCWGDCDDNDSSIHPEAVELCNGVDDDCSETADDVCRSFDVNNDDLIDGFELAWLGRAFGATSGSPENEWWYRIDFNHDGQVDGDDLAILASQDVWGESTSDCVYTCP